MAAKTATSFSKSNTLLSIRLKKERKKIMTLKVGRNVTRARRLGRQNCTDATFFFLAKSMRGLCTGVILLVGGHLKYLSMKLLKVYEEDILDWEKRGEEQKTERER